MSIRKVTIDIEEAGNNYSAYCLEVPGCIATGATRDEVYNNMLDALQFHLEGLKEEGLPSLPNVVVKDAFIPLQEGQ